MGDTWYDTDDNYRVYWWATDRTWRVQQAVGLSEAQAAAISAAALDATTKANNAQSAAITAAASDATTKANNAITTAASDATTKAANAVSQSKTYTDGQVTTVNQNVTAAANSAAAALAAAQAAQATADGAVTTYYQPNPPWPAGQSGHANNAGDMWYDTDDNLAYRWNDQTKNWEPIRDNQIGAALAAAQNAQTTADGKVTAYAASSPPWAAGSNAHDSDFGDIWYDTSNQFRAYFWNTDRTWTLVQSAAIAAAQAAAISAAAADATTKAGNAQSAAISAAASDATTKANNAISTAASDATTKANNAISTAASDATTKAANAQSAAISTAASDATTKANNAVSTAASNAATKYDPTVSQVTNWTYPGTNMIDGGDIQAKTVTTNVLNVVMGGGNLLSDSGFEGTGPLLWTAGGQNNSTLTKTTERARPGAFSTKSLKVVATASGAFAAVTPVVTAINGRPYTLSGWAYVPSGTPDLSLNLYGGVSVGLPSRIATKDAWVRFVLTGTATANSTLNIGSDITATAAGQSYFLDDVQLEEGDVATAYAPRTDETLPGTILGTMIQAQAIDGFTVTGATVQTVATAARGIKLSGSGLIAYNGSGAATLSIDGTTGAISTTGQILSGAGITGATVTGSTVQTEATASRGVKITTGGLTAYNGSGTPTFTVDASTGAVSMLGALTSGSTITGTTVTGGTVTGATVQTTATASSGIKITTAGLTAYNSGGTATFTILASDGSINTTGAILSGGSVTGATVTGGTVQTETTASRGIKVTSGGLTAYDGSGTPTFTIAASTGSVSMKGALTSGSTITSAAMDSSTITGTTITGGTLQTTATANSGVKITSTGLAAYNSGGTATFSILASTGAVSMTGALQSGSTITGTDVTGGTVTGATVQTVATAARGVKISSTGLVAYNGSGTATLTIDGSTGSITSNGNVQTGGSLTGAVVTGGTVQTEATAAKGVKITSAGLTAYNASGVPTVTVDAGTGAVSILGALTSGSTITGATVTGSTVTGGTIQTDPTAARGVKITTGGLVAYDGNGTPTVTITAAGAVTILGNIAVGSTLPRIGGGNLVPDSSMESSDNLFASGGTNVATVTYNTTSPLRGSRSLRLTRTAAGDCYGTTPFNIPAAALLGRRVMVSWDWRASSASAYDGHPALQGSTYNGVVGQGSNTRPTTSWTRAYGYIDVPANEANTYLRLVFRAGPATGDWVEYDGFQVEVGEVPTEYGPKADENLPGSITAGMLTADSINGKTIIGALIRSNPTSDGNRGVAITSGGLTAWDASGNPTFGIVASTGAITTTGPIITGGSVSGATVTGGTVQTQPEPARGIKINSAGLVGYDAAGNPTLAYDAATGTVNIKGNLTVGSTLPPLGGGNVLRGSAMSRDSNADGVADNLTAYTSEGGSPAYTMVNTDLGLAQRLQWSGLPAQAFVGFNIDSQPGFLVTQLPVVSSVYINVLAATASTFYRLQMGNYQPFASLTPGGSPVDLNTLVGVGWRRIYVSRDANSSFDPNGAWYTGPHNTNSAVGSGTILIKNLQFEQGAVPTAYAPRADELLPGSIQAGMLAAGSVIAGTVAAGAITSRELTVASLGDNQVPNNRFTEHVADATVPNGQRATGWVNEEGNTQPYWEGVGVGYNSAYGAAYAVVPSLKDSAGNVTYTSIITDRYMEVSPGDVYSAQALVTAAGQAARLYIRLRWYDATGAALTSPPTSDPVAAGLVLNNGTLTWWGGQVTVPAGAAKARIQVYNNSGYDAGFPNNSGSYLVVKEVSFQRVTLSAQIGNGQITGILIKGDAIDGKTVTGATIQSRGDGNRGVKITNAGMVVYGDGTNGVADGVAAMTITNAGNVSLVGALTAGTTITGAVVTGGTLQTSSTPSSGVKINSAGLTAYDGGGTPTLTVLASTGAISMKGALTSGSTITGSTVTGGTVQSQPETNLGVKITSGGIVGYNASGTPTFNLYAATGTVALSGAITSSTIDSTTVTGGTLQTESAANRGIKINSNGLAAYGPGLNVASDPNATSYSNSGAFGWAQTRWFGGGSGAGSYSLVTNASDGPTGITTYARKTWTATGNTNADTGFDLGAGGYYAVTPGQEYRITVLMRASTAKTANIAIYTNNGGTRLAGSPTVALAAGVWTQLTYTWLVPAGTTNFYPVPDIVGQGTLWAPADTLDATGINVGLIGATVAISATTGQAIFTGGVMSGGTVTGAILQTTSAVASGIKMTPTGLYGYNTNGTQTFRMLAADGSVTMSGSITSGSTIDGATITGSTIQTSVDPALGVKINPSGIVAYDSVATLPDGSANPTYKTSTFAVAAATGTVALTGTLTATSMTVLDKLSIRGTNNSIEGTLYAMATINPPSQQASASYSYPFQATVPNNGTTDQAPALFRGLVQAIGSTNTLLTCNASTNKIIGLNKSGQVTAYAYDTGITPNTNSLLGIASDGTYYYVLFAQAGGQAGNLYYVRRYNQNWAQQGSDFGLGTQNGGIQGRNGDGRDYTVNLNGSSPFIGCTQNGAPIIVWADGSNGYNYYPLVSWGTPSDIYSDTSAFPGLGTSSFAGVYRGTADWGVDRLVLAVRDNSVFVTNATFSGVSSRMADLYAWASPQTCIGLTYDGTNWWSLTNSGVLTRFARNPTAETLRINYTWADRDNGGTGLHETNIGTNPLNFTRPARTALNITTPPPPDSGGSASNLDKANFLGLYIAKFDGSISAQSNPNYPAAAAGDTYTISQAGRIGGASGQVVAIGDVIRANSAAAAGTQAQVGGSWDVVYAASGNNGGYYRLQTQQGTSGYQGVGSFLMLEATTRSGGAPPPTNGFLTVAKTGNLQSQSVNVGTGWSFKGDGTAQVGRVTTNAAGNRTDNPVLGRTSLTNQYSGQTVANNSQLVGATWTWALPTGTNYVHIKFMVNAWSQANQAVDWYLQCSLDGSNWTSIDNVYEHSQGQSQLNLGCTMSGNFYTPPGTTTFYYRFIANNQGGGYQTLIGAANTTLTAMA